MKKHKSVKYAKPKRLVMTRHENAYYIYFKYPIKKGEVKSTRTLHKPREIIFPMINVDYDKDCNILGIEILL